jgi:hypothetical protein
MSKPKTAPINPTELVETLHHRPRGWRNIEQRFRSRRLERTARGMFSTIARNHPYLFEQHGVRFVFEDNLPEGVQDILVTLPVRGVAATLNVVSDDRIRARPVGTALMFRAGETHFTQFGQLYDPALDPALQSRPAGWREDPYAKPFDYQRSIEAMGSLTTLFADPAAEPAHVIPFEQLPDEQLFAS